MRQRIKLNNNRQYNPILQETPILSDKQRVINSKIQKHNVLDSCFGILKKNAQDENQFRPRKRILNINNKLSQTETIAFKPSKKLIANKYNHNSLPGILNKDTQPVIIQRRDKDSFAFGGSKQDVNNSN